MGEWIYTNFQTVMPAAWTETLDLLNDCAEDEWCVEPIIVDGGDTGLVDVYLARECNYGDVSEVAGVLGDLPWRSSHEGKYEIPGEVITSHDGGWREFRGDADGATVQAHAVVAAWDAGMQELAEMVGNLRAAIWHPSAADAVKFVGMADPAGDDEEGE